MKLFFVVNPISGGVDKEPFLNEAEKICNNYGIEYSIFRTTGKNDEVNLLKEIETFKPDKVASVGGDGTTLFTSVTLKDTGLPIGIVPLGSANGMATELYVNPKPIEALKDIIMSELVGGLDVIVVNDKYYTIHIGDVGVNAGIIEAYEADKHRGMATYAKYFIEELKKLDPFPVTVKANNSEITRNGLMVAICNSRKYGTGVPLNVVGNPMDGKFEIVIVEKIDGNSLLKAGLSRFNDKFHDNQNSTTITTDEAEICFTEPRLLQLDGELIGKYEKLSVKILKGAVKLITHRENKYFTY